MNANADILECLGWDGLNVEHHGRGNWLATVLRVSRGRRIWLSAEGATRVKSVKVLVQIAREIFEKEDF